MPGVVPEWRNKAQNNTSALMLTKLLKEMRTRRAPFGRGKGGGREAAERPELVGAGRQVECTVRIQDPLAARDDARSFEATFEPFDRAET